MIDAVMALDPDWCDEHGCQTVHRNDVLDIIEAERARHSALVAAARDASLLAHPAILTGSVDHGQREFPCRCAAHVALRAALDGEAR
jgi:hypothetical protein